MQLDSSDKSALRSFVDLKKKGRGVYEEKMNGRVKYRDRNYDTWESPSSTSALGCKDINKCIAKIAPQ